MTSLPDEFDHHHNDDIQDHVPPMYAEPLLPNVEDQAVLKTEWHRWGRSLAFPTASLSLLLSTVVLIMTVGNPVQKGAAIFGVQGVANVPEMSDMKAHMEIVSKAIAETTHKTDQVVTDLRKVTQDVEQVRSQITELDVQQANQESRVIQLNSKIEAIAARPVIKPVVTKPKEPVKLPVRVTVVSIRSQGGVVWTSLREGLEISPLLAVGDEWRDYKIVSIDLVKRDVQFTANGIVTSVRL